MEKEKLNRINELAKKSKETELTEAEKQEQAALRQEYIAEWRRSTEQLLENVYIDDGSGTPQKLKRKSAAGEKL